MSVYTSSDHQERAGRPLTVEMHPYSRMSQAAAEIYSWYLRE